MTLTERTHAHLRRGVVGFPTALATSVGVVMASPVILTGCGRFEFQRAEVGGAHGVEKAPR